MKPLFEYDFAENYQPNLNMVYEDVNSFIYEFKHSFLLKYFGDVSEEKAALKTLYDGTVKKVYSFINISATTANMATTGTAIHIPINHLFFSIFIMLYPCFSISYCLNVLVSYFLFIFIF